MDQDVVKRDSYIAIISAIDYVAEISYTNGKPVIKCIHSDKNNQCIRRGVRFMNKKKVAFICVHKFMP